MRRIHACGAVMVVGCALLSWMSHWIDPTALAQDVLLVLTILFMMAFAYAYACWRVCHHSASLRVVLFWALAARAAFLPSQPIYETDIYRYLWDGYVVSQGMNPYQYSPQDVLNELEISELNQQGPMNELIADLYQQPKMIDALKNVNNAGLNTIYPPFTQLLFGAVATIAPGSIIAWRGMTLLFDLALMASIIFLLKEFGLQTSRVVFYAWSPLVLKEYINTAHFDVIALSGLFAAFVMFHLNRNSFSSLILAFAAQTKIFPAFVLPLFLKKWRTVNWLLFGATVLVLAAVFYQIGEHGLRGWSAFFQRWEANSSLVAFSEWLLVLLGVPAWGQGVVIGQFSGSSYHIDAFLISKVFCASLWAIMVVYLSSAVWSNSINSIQPVVKRSFILYGMLLICSPVCNPWYIGWVVPFLCFYPRLSWMYLTIVCFLYYSFFIPTPSQQPVWVRTLEYCPFYALLIWEWNQGLWASGSTEA